MAKSIIDQLKANEKPFGLMSEEMQEKAREIGIRNFSLFGENCDCGFSWLAWCAEEESAFSEPHTYRLVPDYAEEPEIVECEITEQRNGTLGYDRSDGITSCSLGSATSYPDFIGFKFEDNVISGYSIRYRHPSGTFVNISLANIGDYEVLHATHVLFRRQK